MLLKRAQAFILASGLSTITLAAQAPPQKRSIPTITRDALKAVVLVVASDKSGKEIRQGSGFVISNNGKVITNYHVIERAETVVIKFSNGAFYFIDGLLAADEEKDIVVLKASGKGFPVVQLGNSERVRVGEEVIAIGSPLALEATVSNGIISAIRESEEEKGKVFQTTAPISPGSSGGPLLNLNGEVIGITTFQLARGQNLNFAIPINNARPLLLASTLIPLAPKAAEPDNRRRPSDSQKVWTNLRNGQNYTTRIQEDRLYIQGGTEICEFEPAKSVGISWIGKCWPSESSAFITLFSDTRIEGNRFVLIPKD